MRRMQLPSVLRQIQQVVSDQAGALPDGELLQRFVDLRDGAAFEAIVWRHGPMVLSVCRRLLQNVHDAEDAFQATFLVLARRAASIARRPSLVAWLYKVAHRIALRARARSRKFATAGFPVTDVPAPANPDESVWRELRPLLDEAIQRLPERYRIPIIVCCLEGNTYRAAAELIGCPVSTLSTRLMRARQMLRRELSRRGVTLPAAVLAAALAESTLSAAPSVALVEASVNAAASLAAGHGAAAGMIPESVASLADDAKTIAVGAKGRAAILLLLAIGTIAGGVAYRAIGHSDRLRPARSASLALPPPNGPSSSGGRPAIEEKVIVRGRVLGPDGKPVANAKLYRPGHPPNAYVWGTRDLELCGQTDHTGTFRVKVPRREQESGNRFYLLAAAQGFGVDWTDPFRDGDSSQLTLRLVKDEPIRGRLLTTEGKPAVGVRLSVRSLRTTNQENLDEPLKRWQAAGRYDLSESLEKRLYTALDNVLKTAVTDANGRFEIAGLGAERVALIVPMGAAVAQTQIYVVTRTGMDFLAYDRAVWKNAPPYMRPTVSWFIHLRGPSFEYVVAPARTIEGTVRDTRTGQPIAGAVVATSSGGDANTIRTTSDQHGRYQLGGLPKLASYHLYVHPGLESRLLPRSIEIPATQGLEPIRQDIKLVAAVGLSGRVVDKATGKGVKSWIDFWPLSETGKPVGDGQSDERGRIHVATSTDETGRFRLNVFPGRGFLAARAITGAETVDGFILNPYLPATPDPAFVKDLSAFRAGNACRLVDVGHTDKFDADELAIERGKSLVIDIRDPDDKPLAGALVSGLTAFEPTVRLPRASCTVTGTTRRVYFFDWDRSLAAMLLLRGDEASLAIVRLQHTGSIKGRLLDMEGRALSRIRVAAWPHDEQLLGLYDLLSKRKEPIFTDTDGRFVVNGLVPAQEFRLLFGKEEMFRVATPPLGLRKVASGETLDLGDIRTKPR